MNSDPVLYSVFSQFIAAVGIMVIGYLGCPTHCGNPLLLLGTPLLRSYCAGCTLFLLLSWREMNLYHSPRVASNTRRYRSSCSDFRFAHKVEGSSRWIYVLFTWSSRVALFPDRRCRLRVAGLSSVRCISCQLFLSRFLSFSNVFSRLLLRVAGASCCLLKAWKNQLPPCS